MTASNQIQHSATGGGGKGLKLFALLSYGAFSLQFAYYAFYLAGVWVPVHIDNIHPAPVPEMLMVNIALVLMFAVQHTIMASRGYKTWFAERFNPVWERPLFVAVSTFVFLVLMWQWRSHPQVIWQVEAGWAVALLWALYICGWLIMLISTYLIDHWHLFGLRQAFRGLEQKESAGGFVTPLFYRLVCHPMMTGVVILLWATPFMTLGHLVMSTALTMYVLAGIRFEETKLIEELGPEYEEYRARTPALFPGLKPGKR